MDNPIIIPIPKAARKSDLLHETKLVDIGRNDDG
eukprot:CAMPEP_0171314876 /NCGR_PEP_ID=MMETSP0816-20121228/57936_1 /TAXON_ID=420281 /ORGANISM="Proboscia inermis, Strain CCAP1064/1" /LENGTH=33 /DNA_ID= /DNA_START= /DNA_END= /DNA_ORIENTATION=